MKKVKSAAVILNGQDNLPNILDNYVICADGGYNLYAPKTPDCIIGDMDSVIKLPTNVEILSYPSEKNETDGQLAILKAINEGYKNINIYGAFGGRIDHILSNISLLSYANRNGASATIVANDCMMYYITGELRLKVKKDTIISVIPYNGDIIVGEYKNLQYNIVNHLIPRDSSLGMSNIAIEEDIYIKINSGEALIIVNLK